MKSRRLVTPLVFAVCGGWLALASPPSPLTLGFQIKESAPVSAFGLSIKINCPTMSYAGQPTVGGSEAASWTPANLSKQGIKAGICGRIMNPGVGYDTLHCTYTLDNGQNSSPHKYANAKFSVARSAPTTHPICKSDWKTTSFECRRLKPGERYTLQTQY